LLKKVSDEVETAELSLARAWTRTAIVTTNEVAYEGLFFALGEAGHVLRMVLRFAQRLPKSERPAFLSERTTGARRQTCLHLKLATLPFQQTHDRSTCLQPGNVPFLGGRMEQHRWIVAGVHIGERWHVLVITP
jgi:hypothetical protein